MINILDSNTSFWISLQVSPLKECTACNTCMLHAIHVCCLYMYVAIHVCCNTCMLLICGYGFRSQTGSNRFLIGLDWIDELCCQQQQQQQQQRHWLYFAAGAGAVRSSFAAFRVAKGQQGPGHLSFHTPVGKGAQPLAAPTTSRAAIFGVWVFRNFRSHWGSNIGPTVAMLLCVLIMFLLQAAGAEI